PEVLQHSQCFQAIERRPDLCTPVLQGLGDDLQVVRFIVYQQHFPRFNVLPLDHAVIASRSMIGCSSVISGSTTEKVLPTSSVLLTMILPFITRTSVRVMARPSPEPL